MQKGQCTSGARLMRIWCASGGGDLSAERSVRMWCASNLKFEAYFEILYPL